MYFSEETYYYMLALLTTIAFIYSLYLIFYVSTPQMKPYVYLLLNIQSAAYLEVMFGALMCSVWMSPHLGVKADGVLWKLSGIPVQHLFGIFSLLYCCATNALNAAYFYRYRLCLFDSVIRFSKRTLMIIIVFIYTLSIGTLVPLSILSFKGSAESVAEVKKTDPERDLGENFALIGGPTAKLYILVKNLLTCMSFAAMIVIVKHTSKILRNQARFSESSRKMHKEAIMGLVVQTIIITLTDYIPIFMLCLAFYAGSSSQSSSRTYAFVGCMMLASKSFNGTVSMIVSTTCYRKEKGNHTTFKVRRSPMFEASSQKKRLPVIRMSR